MNRPEVIEAAKLAILAAAIKNPAITPLGLIDEMQRADISGWLHLPTIAECTFGEWTAAMSAASEELGRRQPCHATEAIANADAHLGNVGLPTYTELLAALRAVHPYIKGSTSFEAADKAAAALLCKHDARMVEAAARHG